MKTIKAIWLPVVLLMLIAGQAATAWLLWETREAVRNIASEQDYGEPDWVGDIKGAAKDAEDAAHDAERAAIDAASKAAAACRASGGSYLSC